MSTEPKQLKVVHSNNKILHYSTRILVILIAVGAGILSFDGLAQLATAAGVRPELSYIWALVIDGFILVATFATFALKDRSDGDRIKKYYAWVVLAVFVIISIFGNAMHSLPADDTYVLPMWVKICVNAVPPIALFLAIHLIIIMVSPTADEKKRKEAEKRRIEREERMKERKLLAAERLNEKEAQQIEKASPNLNNTMTPQPVTPQPKTAPISQPAQTHKQTTTTPHPSTGNFITKEEATQRIIQMIQNGEKLPSGREVGEWIGLKERAGQNLLKTAKQAVEPVNTPTET